MPLFPEFPRRWRFVQRVSLGKPSSPIPSIGERLQIEFPDLELDFVSEKLKGHGSCSTWNVMFKETHSGVAVPTHAMLEASFDAPTRREHAVAPGIMAADRTFALESVPSFHLEASGDIPLRTPGSIILLLPGGPLKGHGRPPLGHFSLEHRVPFSSSNARRESCRVLQTYPCVN